MASQSAPASYTRPRRRGVIGPLILVFIGCVFLLQNAGYLPPNFWVNLWRLWPVVLVLAGVELLLGSRVPWLILAALSLAVLVVGTAAILSPSWTGPVAAPVSITATVDLSGAQKAALTVRFDAGELNVAAIEQPVVTQLATLTYSGPEALAPQPRYSPNGDTGRLDISPEDVAHRGFLPFGDRSGTPRLDLNLNPATPISSLSIKAGATNARLDLSALHVTDVDASLGAASTWLRVPQAAGATTVRMSGGASNVNIEVPPGVAARIRFRGGMSTISVDQTRFPAIGENAYQSSDFDSNPNSADITIDGGLTRIQVN